MFADTFTFSGYAEGAGPVAVDGEACLGLAELEVDVCHAEGYLADVAIIFSLLGFLAVVLLTKIYTGIWLKRKGEKHHA